MDGKTFLSIFLEILKLTKKNIYIYIFSLFH